MADEETKTITVTPDHIADATEDGTKDGGLRALAAHLGHDFDELLRRNDATLRTEAAVRGFDHPIYRDIKDDPNGPVTRQVDAHIFPGTQLVVPVSQAPEPTPQGPGNEDEGEEPTQP